MKEQIIQKSKRVTNNFQRLMYDDGTFLKDWNRWRDEQEKKGHKFIYDRRNNIYCMDPTMDYEMYYNYLMYLNSSYTEWRTYGYLDMGMVPYMMWPSFMDSSIVLEHMRGIARKIGITLIPVPGVSFLKDSYITNGTDYWVFREDLLKLARALEAARPNFVNFGFKSEADVCTSRFVEELSRISKLIGGMQNEPNRV